LLGSPNLTRGYGALDDALRRTVPGMADVCDLASLHVCRECVWWRPGKASRGSCDLFTHRMNGKSGPPLAGSQKACKVWTSDLQARQRVDRPPLDTSDFPPLSRMPGT
jgi:hypothetical protein